MNLNKKLIIFFLSLFLSLTYFSILVGIENLNLSSKIIFQSYDNISDFLAFKFFISDKWRFPLGLNPNYGDIDNSIVFSGAVPFLSFLFKILENFYNSDIHFFNYWIFFNFFLITFISIHLIYYYSKDIFYSAAASPLFSLSPVLLNKIFEHFSLGAHWIILLTFYLEFNKGIKNKIFYRAIIILLSSLIHFYFTVMLILFIFLIIITNPTAFDRFKILSKNFFFISIPLILLMYSVGYFSIPLTDSLGFGFGVYKSNFLTFVDVSSPNGISFSNIIPDIKNNLVGESEGYGYVGSSILIIFVIIIFFYNKKILIIKKHYNYLIIFLVFFFIACSNNISFGGVEIVSIKLPDLIYAAGSVIRASGRFIWIPVYLISIFAIICFYKLNIKYKSIALILLSLFHIYECKNFIDYLKKKNSSNIFLNKNYHSLDFLDKYKKFSFVSTLPKDTSTNFFDAANILINYDVINTNIARLGRYNRKELSKSRSEIAKTITENSFKKNTIYLVENNNHLRQLKFLFSQNSNFGILFRKKMVLLVPDGKYLMNSNDYKNLSLIKIEKIMRNKNYNLQLINNHNLLGFGWTHGSFGKTINHSGVWTEGENSFILFKNNTESKNLDFINLDIEDVFCDSFLKVNFYVNNTLIKKINLKKNFRGVLKLHIDTKNIKPNKINILKIEIKNTLAPIDKLISVDGRLLGLKVNKVFFE